VAEADDLMLPVQRGAVLFPLGAGFTLAAEQQKTP
jgi:hypothetical protein